ncbi:MAG: MerR family transcriptional regulator [Lachnotalea sp.]
MKINEVSKLTGLSQKTIRYYEERGLIIPDIKLIRDRNFRDYSTETVTRLTSIATLRKLLFSLDEIMILINQPEQINSILADYQTRITSEIKEKNMILTTLSILPDKSSISDIDSLSYALKDISKKYKLPSCDINPDFSTIDPKEPGFDNDKEIRINTKHSIFAKKANGMELFILELLWTQETLDFNTIVHKCIEQGILSESDAIANVVKRMCRRKLIQVTNHIYKPLVTPSNIEFRNFDLMIQTAYNGSPSKMIYTPPVTPTSFGGGGKIAVLHQSVCLQTLWRPAGLRSTTLPIHVMYTSWHIVPFY